MLNHQQSRSPSARPWGTEPKGHPAGEQRAADKPQFVANPPGYGRRTPGRFTLIGAGVWFGIMLLAVMAYGYRYEIGKLGDRLAAILVPGHGYWADDKTVSYFADESGQFWVDGRVNGNDFRFIVDTGATSIVFNKADARRLGFDLEALHFDRFASTANGRVHYAPVRLRQVTIGPVVAKDVPAEIDDGDLRHPLLGMEFLSRMGRFEIANGILTIHK
jgi:aspartyl protease family protein